MREVIRVSGMRSHGCISFRAKSGTYNGRIHSEGKWPDRGVQPGRDTGRLEASFFGPFYSGHNVITIDRGYRYALTAGNNRKLLVYSSRTPQIPGSIRQVYGIPNGHLSFKPLVGAGGCTQRFPPRFKLGFGVHIVLTGRTRSDAILPY